MAQLHEPLLKYIEPTERELFLLLFYRERIWRLIQRLESQEGARAAQRKRHRKNVAPEWDLNVLEVASLLKDFTRRAEDRTRCNDLLKSMYFCDLPKGHKGKHGEFVFGRTQKRIEGKGWLVWPQEKRRR
jgi:hypothetical protein